MPRLLTLLPILWFAFKKDDCLLNGFLAFRVEEREGFHGTFQVLGGYKLLLELAYDCSLLFQGKDGIATKFVRSRLHPLPIQGYQACIRLICLGNRKHHTGEVLYLEWVLQTHCDICLRKKINKQGTVIAGCFQHTMMLIGRQGLNELVNAFSGILEGFSLTVLAEE